MNVKKLTVIINSVAYPENGEDEGDQGGARRVLASEEAALETIQAWCSIAFWKFGVEVDKRAKASTGTPRLYKCMTGSVFFVLGKISGQNAQRVLG